MYRNRPLVHAKLLSVQFGICPDGQIALAARCKSGACSINAVDAAARRSPCTASKQDLQYTGKYHDDC
nr:hypothetical protein CFP56_13099 [Quercus suber]